MNIVEFVESVAGIKLLDEQKDILNRLQYMRHHLHRDIDLIPPRGVEHSWITSAIVWCDIYEEWRKTGKFNNVRMVPDSLKKNEE